MKSASFDTNESSQAEKIPSIENRDKSKLEGSLNDLCLQIKRVSERSLGESRNRRGISEGLAGSFWGCKEARSSLRKATSLLDAREALQTTYNRYQFLATTTTLFLIPLSWPVFRFRWCYLYSSPIILRYRL